MLALSAEDAINPCNLKTSRDAHRNKQSWPMGIHHEASSFCGDRCDAVGAEPFYFLVQVSSDAAHQKIGS